MKKLNFIDLYFEQIKSAISNIKINSLKLAISILSIIISLYYGLTVVCPYVGMAEKQDGGSNRCISVYAAISPPGNKC